MTWKTPCSENGAPLPSAQHNSSHFGEAIDVSEYSADSASSNQSLVRLRLGAMMCLVFTPLSCWWVTVATYIETHTGTDQMFSLGFVGTAYSTGAIAAMIAPMFWGVMADRFFSAERIMCGLQIAGGLLLWQLTQTSTQTAWWWMMLAYMFCFSPMFGLANAICFRHLEDVERTYPPIRALGTLSWILGGWLVGYIAPIWFGHSIEDTLWPMRLGVVAHVLAAVSCLLVPATKPLPKSEKQNNQSIGWMAITTVFSRTLWLPVVCMLLLAVSIPFYNNLINIFLNARHVGQALGHLSWGQVTELGCLFLLPVSLSRLGVKWTLLVGASAWVLRYLLLSCAEGSLLALYWPAILLHGFSFSFTFMTIQIYADRVSADECRAAVQGVISVIMSGVGVLIGSQLTGICQIRYLSQEPHDWKTIWLIAAALATAPTLLLLFTKNMRPGK